MNERSVPRLSINLGNFSAQDPGGWSHLIDRALAADEAGIDRVAVSDHVVFGENIDAYGQSRLGGRDGGKQPTGPDGHWLEPLTTLTYLAAITTHTRLMTSILLATLRRPVVLAKQAGTIDVLSGGRLDLGVGVGWQREEYEAAGLDFEGRGELLDRTLEVCQALWTSSPTTFESPELTFSDIHQMPKPLGPRGVPVWVSGTVNERVARRLGRFGSGWIPWGEAADDPLVGVPRMRDAVAEAGYEPEGFEILGTLRVMTDSDGAPNLEATMAQVPELVDLGITDFRLAGPIPADRAAATEHLGVLAQAFRRV